MPSIPWGRGFLPALGLVLALQLAMALANGWSPLAGELWGPDSYMRVSRTLACEGGGACPEGVFLDTNAPFGEVLHWPYLEDRLLLALSAPFRLTFETREAVLLASGAFGPLLAAGSIALVLLIARTLVSPPGLYFAGIFLACQPWVFHAFAAPRPDHHGLQGFLFLGMVAGALHLVRDPSRRSWSAVTGACLGLGLWVSTEALVTGLPVLFGLGLLWVVGGLHVSARANRDVAAVAVGVLTLGLLVDAPPEALTAVQYDRFSIVHWSAFSLLAVMWGGIVSISDRGRSPGSLARLGWLCGGAIVCATLMALLFPPFFGGPMVEIDARLPAIWLDQTSEFLPVAEHGRLLVVVLHLTSSLLAVPVLLWQAARGDREKRSGWLFLLGLFVWFMALTLFLHGRWALYLHLLVSIPLAYFIGRLVTWPAPSQSVWVRAVVHVGAVVGVMSLPVVLALTLARAEGAPGGSRASAECSASSIVPFLGELARDRRPGTVLAPADWGPEIVFRTPHQAVASPYHRNATGLLDSHTFMSATDDMTALSIAQERGIDWVVLCRDRPWFPVVTDGAEPTLHARLSGLRSPSWLTAVPLPGDVDGPLMVYEVNR
ncbi:MAG: hypothetical protein HKN72_10940 [Gemmatimonadetes bacterium]|nr:hypothetical protein [Gemmatimonadota bacterium]